MAFAYGWLALCLAAVLGRFTAAGQNELFRNLEDGDDWMNYTTTGWDPMNDYMNDSMWDSTTDFMNDSMWDFDDFDDFNDSFMNETDGIDNPDGYFWYLGSWSSCNLWSADVCQDQTGLTHRSRACLDSSWNWVYDDVCIELGLGEPMIEMDCTVEMPEDCPDETFHYNFTQGGSAVTGNVTFHNPNNMATAVNITVSKTTSFSSSYSASGYRRLSEIPKTALAQKLKEVEQKFTLFNLKPKKAAAGTAAAGAAAEAGAASSSSAESVTAATQAASACGGKLIVQLKSTAEAGAGRRLKEDKAVGIKAWKALPKVGLEVAEVDCSQVGSTEEAVAALESKYGSELELVEVDQKVKMFAKTPSKSNDPYAMLQWHLRNTRVAEAWERVMPLSATRKEVVIAVIDTGVEVHHPDLAENMWQNPGEIAGNGIDDDANGFIDDVYGWDFVRDIPAYDDPNGHGTHCAGVIAASSNNSEGVIGTVGNSSVASVKVMTVGVFDEEGYGLASDTIAGLNYALEMGATLSSNSYGFTSTADNRSAAMEVAVQAALSANHFIVAAAGNGGAYHSDYGYYKTYPCDFTYDNIVCVGSVGPAMGGSYWQSSFSDYGSSFVDIAAPGQYILSTYPNASYSFMDGTSMATPGVAGAIALVLSNFPDLTPKEVKTMLMETTSHQDLFDDDIFGSGVLDVAAFVARANGDDLSVALRIANDKGEYQSAPLMVTAPAMANYTINTLVGGSYLRSGYYESMLKISPTDDGLMNDTLYQFKLDVKPPMDGFAAPYETTFDLTGKGWEGSVVVGTGYVGGTYFLSNQGEQPAAALITGIYEEEGWTVMAYDSEYNVLNESGMANISSGGSLMLNVYCHPQSVGTSTRNVVIRTNMMLTMEDAAKPGAIYEGAVWEFPFICTGEPAPSIAIDVPGPSGVHLTVDGEPVSARGSAPAEWNQYWPTGMVSGPVVMTNSIGCNSTFDRDVSGTIVVLQNEHTTNCSVAQQAEYLAAAGALGHIMFSSTDLPYENDFGSDKMVIKAKNVIAMPSIPTFQIPSDVAQQLSKAFEANKTVMGNVSWSPLLKFEPGMNDTITVPVQVTNNGDKALEYSVLLTPAFDASMDDFYMRSYVDGMLTDDDLEEVESNYSYGMLKLPFTFPYFSEMLDEVKVSFEGYLYWSDDADQSLGEANETSSVIAPAYQHYIEGRILAGMSPRGDAYVIQWRDMVPYDEKSMEGMFAEDDMNITEPLPYTFEVRLYKDGSLGFLYEVNQPLDEIEDPPVSYFSSRDDWSTELTAADISQGLEGEVLFTRWGVYVDEPSATLEPGESANLTVQVKAGEESKGLLFLGVAPVGGYAAMYELIPIIWPADDVCQYSTTWSDCSAECPGDAAGEVTLLGSKSSEILCLSVATGKTCAPEFCLSNASGVMMQAESMECNTTLTCKIVVTTTPIITTTTLMTISTGNETISVGDVATTETISSSLTLGGDEQPGEETLAAVASGIENSLGLDEDDEVVIDGVEQAVRRMRRLASGWVVSFTVKIVSTAASTGDSGTTAAAAFTQLTEYVSDPSELLTAVVTAMTDAGVNTTGFTLTAQAPAAIQTIMVAWVAGEYGSCEAPEGTVCETEFNGTQTRTAWCAQLVDNVPTQVNATECEGLSQMGLTQDCTGTAAACETTENSGVWPSTSASSLVLALASACLAAVGLLA